MKGGDAYVETIFYLLRIVPVDLICGIISRFPTIIRLNMPKRLNSVQRQRRRKKRKLKPENYEHVSSVADLGFAVKVGCFQANKKYK